MLKNYFEPQYSVVIAQCGMLQIVVAYLGSESKSLFQHPVRPRGRVEAFSVGDCTINA